MNFISRMCNRSGINARHRLSAAIAVLACCFTLSPHSNAAEVFYTDIVTVSGTAAVVSRIDSDGTGLTRLFTGILHPRGVAVDRLGGRIYWNELGLGAIRRANLDGSGSVETVVSTGDSAPGLALDVAGGKIYWVGGSHDGWIRRANLDGSTPEGLVTSGVYAPTGIALDLVHGKVYWTDPLGSPSQTGKGSIRYCNLDGTGDQWVLTELDNPAGIQCDAAGGKIYWVEFGQKRIQRANLDGTAVETVLSGLESPTSLSLDLSERKMYWTDSAWNGQVNRIQRANLDGTSVEVILSGVGFPWGIAVVPDLVRVPTRATATAQVVNGFLVGISIVDPGFGYTNNPAPAIRIRDDSGNGAVAHAVVNNGIVESIVIDNPGKGYTPNMKIVIAPPPFSPSLSLKVSKVQVTMAVVLGRKYRLDASSDLVSWTSVGDPFVAEDDAVVKEVDVIEVGRFFRVQEVP